MQKIPLGSLRCCHCLEVFWPYCTFMAFSLLSINFLGPPPNKNNKHTDALWQSTLVPTRTVPAQRGKIAGARAFAFRKPTPGWGLDLFQATSGVFGFSAAFWCQELPYVLDLLTGATSFVRMPRAEDFLGCSEPVHGRCAWCGWCGCCKW